MKKPRTVTAFQRGTNGKCPVCGGNENVLYDKSVQGYEGLAPLTYATPCTACQAGRRAADNTGVPIEFRGLKISDFDFGLYGVNCDKLEKIARSFVDSFSTWQDNGKGLYFWSRTPGSGKTMLSAILAQEVAREQDISMRFITAPDYLSSVGESYKVERGQIDPSKIYRDVKLLVLDDVGAQKTGDWQNQELFRLIDERMKSGNVTLFTSNCAPSGLNLDDRTVSRIEKVSVILQIPEVSIRRKKAVSEQNAFLESILKEAR